MVVLDAFFSYSWPLGLNDEAQAHGLFRDFCFLNHSCRPNAILIWHEVAKKMILHALEPIEKDQEILVSYLTHPFKTKEARHRELRFDCQCVLCTSDAAAVEEAYDWLDHYWSNLDQAHIFLLRSPLAVDCREVDRSQIRLISDNLKPGNVTLFVAEEFCRIAHDLEIKHVGLARIYELVSAAKLAWFMTHNYDAGRDKFMSESVTAKAKEIGVLLFCTGLVGGRGEDRLKQLWYMTVGHPHRDVLFSSLLGEIGLEGKVHGNRMDLYMPPQ